MKADSEIEKELRNAVERAMKEHEAARWRVEHLSQAASAGSVYSGASSDSGADAEARSSLQLARQALDAALERFTRYISSK